jgi:hypothetical protein
MFRKSPTKVAPVVRELAEPIHFWPKAAFTSLSCPKAAPNMANKLSPRWGDNWDWTHFRACFRFKILN